MPSGWAEQRALVVVIAAYNEASVIAGVIAELKQRFPHVVVVDDGSSDGTAERALAAGAVVIRHPVNLGQGAALQTGITYAIGEGAALIATFDADGQHAAADIARMVDALTATGADVALGSRFLGRAIGLPASRKAMLKLAVAFTRWTTGLNLTDSHNGLRLFTRAAAMKIRISQNRMAHASEILSAIAQHKLRYVEVPVSIRYTAYSQAKGQKLAGAFRVLSDIIAGKVAR